MDTRPLDSPRSLVDKGLTRLGALLIEPSSLVVDVVARRRARLLATLQLVHALQLALSAIIVRFTDHGVARGTVPLVLGVAAPCVLVA